LAIYRHGLGFELRVTVKHIQVVVRAELKARISGCQSDALTTLPWPWPICTHSLHCTCALAPSWHTLAYGTVLFGGGGTKKTKHFVKNYTFQIK